MNFNLKCRVASDELHMSKRDLLRWGRVTLYQVLKRCGPCCRVLFRLPEDFRAVCVTQPAHAPHSRVGMVVLMHLVTVALSEFKPETDAAHAAV